MPPADSQSPAGYTLRTELLLADALAPNATSIPDALSSRGMRPNPGRT